MIAPYKPISTLQGLLTREATARRGYHCGALHLRGSPPGPTAYYSGTQALQVGDGLVRRDHCAPNSVPTACTSPAIRTKSVRSSQFYGYPGA